MYANLYRARPAAAPDPSPKEARMNWNVFIRRTHRWVAMVFTLLVLANMAACSFGPPPAWLTYAPLLPLLLLMLGGLVLFFQPYRARARRRAPTREA